MKNIKKLIATALIATTMFTVVGCSNNTNKSAYSDTLNTVLAEVNNKQFTLGDIDKELKGLIEDLKTQFGDDFINKIDKDTLGYLNNERSMVLQQLVQEEILLKKANDLKLKPSDEEMKKLLDEKVKDLEKYYGGKENLDEAKEYYGYTDETFSTFMESQIIQETVVEEVTKDVTVSDDEIKTYYNDKKDTLFTTKPGASSKHILFETEEEANKVVDQINKKELTFEEAFDKYTENKAAGEFPLAEDLGYVEYEEENYDEDFLKGFKILKEGEVSKPVKSSFGYHVIKATGLQNETTVTPLKDVEDSIKEDILYNKKYEVFQNALIEWETELNVKLTAESIGYNPPK